MSRQPGLSLAILLTIFVCPSLFAANGGGHGGGGHSGGGHAGATLAGGVLLAILSVTPSVIR